MAKHYYLVYIVSLLIFSATVSNASGLLKVGTKRSASQAELDGSVSDVSKKQKTELVETKESAEQKQSREVQDFAAIYCALKGLPTAINVSEINEKNLRILWRDMCGGLGCRL